MPNQPNFDRDDEAGYWADRDDRDARSEPMGYGRGGYGREPMGYRRDFGEYHPPRQQALQEFHGDDRYGRRVGDSDAGNVGHPGAGDYGQRYDYDRPVPSGMRGKGPRNFVRSDDRIRELACDALTDDDLVDATNIEVSVRDGEVTLAGTVEDRRMKRLAEDCVDRLPGVRDVHNQLRIQPPA